MTVMNNSLEVDLGSLSPLGHVGLAERDCMLLSGLDFAIDLELAGAIGSNTLDECMMLVDLGFELEKLDPALTRLFEPQCNLPPAVQLRCDKMPY